MVDEYHEHATDALYTTMLTGMGARRQPLMWAITTARYNIEGPCYDKRREVIEMLNGSVPNDELFGIIYTVDEGDDWTDPQVLEKANPNIGVSVYREFLLSQQQRAKNNARLANVFKTKHLNIWVSARSAYFNLVSWQSCEDKSLTLEQFEGQPYILAFDLARKLDMNSMARLYTREIDGKTHYYSVAPRFWVPYDTVYSVEKNEDRRTAERFQKWVEMGVLTVTDGAEVDYRYILEEAKAANKISPVSESPIDPFGATGLSHDLADEDLNPVTIIQNYTNMSDPMKELEAAIESGRFHHDGNPIMTWCIGNVVGKTIPGTRAWTYRHWMGTGTVGVMIAGSDLINPIPEESTETAARQHIGPLAPVAGSDLYVFRPVAHTVDFHIRVTPDTPEIRAAITAELRSFLLRDGYPQGELKVSRISEAISGANGEYSHQLLAPADNISIAKNELAVLGTISWT